MTTRALQENMQNQAIRQVRAALSTQPISENKSIPILQLTKPNTRKTTPVVVYLTDMGQLSEEELERHRMSNELNGTEDRQEIMFNGSEPSPLPDINQRSVLYCFGPSGSGKSTYVREFIRNFVRIYPDAPIFLFSRVEEDPAFSEFDIIHVPLCDQLLNAPIMAADLPRGSLCIFDDIDSIDDKEIRECVMSIRSDILEIGRHRRLHCCVTSHLASDYRKTRTIINEATQITFFPGNPQGAIRQFLNVKLGLDKKTCDQILKSPSRWVTISPRFPMFYFDKYKVYLL